LKISNTRPIKSHNSKIISNFFQFDASPFAWIA
jgi:hypothetical protein